MSWSSAKNFKGYYYLLLCCIFDQVCSELFLGTSANVLASVLKDFTFVDGSWFSYSLVQKRGGPPFESEKKVKNATFLTVRSCCETLGCGRTVKVVQWASPRKEKHWGIASFAFITPFSGKFPPLKLLYYLRMRLLPVTVGDALDRNVFRGRTGASQRKAVIVLTAHLIQGARLKHTFPPWVALFQRHLNNLEAQALLNSSLVQTCCGAGFTSFSSDCLR